MSTQLIDSITASSNDLDADAIDRAEQDVAANDVTDDAEVL